MTAVAPPSEPTNIIDWVPLMPALPEKPRTALLTQMQARVLESLCEGKSNAEITKDWGISEDTVKSHVKELLRRTGTNTRLQVVVQVLTGQVRIQLTRSVRWDGPPLDDFARDELLGRGLCG